MLLPGSRQLERITDYSVASTFRKNRLLHRQLVFRSRIQSASDLRVLAFVILANHADVDVPGFKIPDRRLNPAKKFCRAQVDILAKTAPYRDQQPPQRNVIGDPRKSDSAQKDGIAVLQLVETILGHHSTCLYEAFAAPIEVAPCQTKVKFTADRLYDAQPFRNNFASYAVSLDHCDFVFLQPSPRVNVSAHGFTKGELSSRGMHIRVQCFHKI